MDKGGELEAERNQMKKKKKQKQRRKMVVSLEGCPRSDEIVSVIRRKLARSDVPRRGRRGPTCCSSWSSRAACAREYSLASDAGLWLAGHSDGNKEVRDGRNLRWKTSNRIFLGFLEEVP